MDGEERRVRERVTPQSLETQNRLAGQCWHRVRIQPAEQGNGLGNRMNGQKGRDIDKSRERCRELGMGKERWPSSLLVQSQPACARADP